ARTSRAKGFDFDQFEIELMHHCGGLECVVGALCPHPRGGDSPKLWVEELNQPASGFMVAVAKARHQPAYGIRRKRGWCRHWTSKLKAVEKNLKATIQSAGLFSH